MPERYDEMSDDITNEPQDPKPADTPSSEELQKELERYKSKATLAEKEAIERRKALKEWESLGVDPETAKQVLSEREKAEQEKLEKTGNFEKLLEQHQNKWKTERETLVQELNRRDQIIRKTTVDATLATALSGAGVTKEGASLLMETLSKRVQVEMEGEKVSFTILSQDLTTPMAGSETPTASFKDLVKEAMDSYPMLFASNVNSGSGKPVPGAGGKPTVQSWGEAKSNKEKVELVRQKYT